MNAILPLVAAEWTKARTVRSTWWTLFTTAVLCLGLGALLGSQFSGSTSRQRGDIGAAQISFYPLLLGQIALVAFGVLLTSAEYTTGTIRASLAAVPRRGAFLAAKALVAAGVAGVAAVAVGFGTFFVTQWAISENAASLGDPEVLRAVLGGCLHLTMMCVFAMGVAVVLALGILIPLLFLNSQGLASIPAIRSVTQYLPDQAGAAMTRMSSDAMFILGPVDFGPGQAFLIMLAWVATALVGGYVSLRRRDA